MDFDYSISLPSICTPVTMGAVAAIHEYKGKQELYQALKPESFEKLAAVARVQSIGSSNKIEGIETTDARLEALAAGKVEPRNRNECEIAGYRYVLDLIHERYAHIPVRRMSFFSCIGICMAWKKFRLLADGKTPTTLSLSVCPMVGSERVSSLPVRLLHQKL